MSRLICVCICVFWGLCAGKSCSATFETSPASLQPHIDLSQCRRFEPEHLVVEGPLSTEMRNMFPRRWIYYDLKSVHVTRCISACQFSVHGRYISNNAFWSIDNYNQRRLHIRLSSRTTIAGIHCVKFSMIYLCASCFCRTAPSWVVNYLDRIDVGELQVPMPKYSVFSDTVCS